MGTYQRRVTNKKSPETLFVWCSIPPFQYEKPCRRTRSIRKAFETDHLLEALRIDFRFRTPIGRSIVG